MGQDVPKGARLIGKQCTEQPRTIPRLHIQKLCHADDARHRQPTQSMRENTGQNRPEQVNRHGVARQSAGHQRIVEPATTTQRRDNPQSHTDNRGDQHGRKRQLQCRDKVGEKVVQHRHLVTERFTKVAMQQAHQVVPILHQDRLIQPQTLHGGGVQLRVNRAFAHHDLDHVTRNQTNQGKR